MQLRLRLSWPPKLFQSGTQDNVCAEGPLPVTPCCLSWSRSSHLSPGPPQWLPTHFSIPWSPISYPLDPTIPSVQESHQGIPFQKPCENFYCTHDKSQSLCMTARAWMVRPLPVSLRFISWPGEWSVFSVRLCDLPTPLPARLTILPLTSLKFFRCQHKHCLFRKASSDHTF